MKRNDGVAIPSIGVVLAWICIALFIANMVYLHQAARTCAVQNEPGTHHDWEQLLDNLETQ